jgi:hypothetical protein
MQTYYAPMTTPHFWPQKTIQRKPVRKAAILSLRQQTVRSTPCHLLIGGHERPKTIARQTLSQDRKVDDEMRAVLAHDHLVRRRGVAGHAPGGDGIVLEQCVCRFAPTRSILMGASWR